MKIDSFKCKVSLNCSTISSVANGPSAILAGSPGISLARQKITIETPKNTIIETKILLKKYCRVFNFIDLQKKAGLYRPAIKFNLLPFL